MAQGSQVYGLSKKGIYYADVPTNGDIQELDDMDYLSDIVEDSMQNTSDDDTYVEIKSLEDDDIDIQIMTEVGARRLEFATHNMSPENMQLAFGGTIDANGTWKAPAEHYTGDMKAIAFVTRAPVETGLHKVYHMPRVKLTAKQQGGFVKDNVISILFSATIFIPRNATGDKMPHKIVQSKPAAPTNGVVDDTANTFGWTPVDAFPAATDYEISVDGGTTYADVTVNPSVITPPVPAGDVLVRVKESTTHIEGFELASKEEFTA